MQQISSDSQLVDAVRSEYEFSEIAEFEIRSQSTQKMRNINRTSFNSRDIIARRYYCEPLEIIKEETCRAIRLFSEPKAGPIKLVELEIKWERVSWCNFFVADKKLKGEDVKLITKLDRTKQMVQSRTDVNREKLHMRTKYAQIPTELQ